MWVVGSMCRTRDLKTWYLRKAAHSLWFFVGSPFRKIARTRHHKAERKSCRAWWRCCQRLSPRQEASDCVSLPPWRCVVQSAQRECCGLRGGRIQHVDCRTGAPVGHRGAVFVSELTWHVLSGHWVHEEDKQNRRRRPRLHIPEGLYPERKHEHFYQQHPPCFDTALIKYIKKTKPESTSDCHSNALSLAPPSPSSPPAPCWLSYILVLTPVYLQLHVI